jgi:hypothetical protein
MKLSTTAFILRLDPRAQLLQELHQDSFCLIPVHTEL